MDGSRSPPVIDAGDSVLPRGNGDEELLSRPVLAEICIIDVPGVQVHIDARGRLKDEFLFPRDEVLRHIV